MFFVFLKHMDFIYTGVPTGAREFKYIMRKVRDLVEYPEIDEEHFEELLKSSSVGYGEPLPHRTKSLCPESRKVVPAVVWERDGKVWITKRCPEGLITELYYEDFDTFERFRRWFFKGKVLKSYHVDSSGAKCPFECGLCKRHHSHTCLLNVVVTNRCNLSCWYCLPEEEEILIRKNGKVKLLKFKELARDCKFDHEVEVDGIRGRFAFVDGLEVLSFKDFKAEWCKVEKVFKRFYKGKIVRITTKTGRVLRVTPEHRIFVYQNGSLFRREAGKLKVGDMVLSLLRFNVNGRTLNLLREFRVLPTNEKRMTFVRGVDVNTRLSKRYGSIVYSWRERRYIPLNVFYEIDLDGSYELGRDATRYTIPSNFVITPEFSKLVGYFVSDGHYTNKDVRINVGKNDAERELFEIVRKLNLPHSVLKANDKAKQLVLGSRLIRLLFKYVLGIPEGAKNKRLPRIFLDLPLELRLSLLSGLLNGDGYVVKGKRHLSMASVSRGLIRDLLYLLASLGVFARVYNVEKEKFKGANYDLIGGEDLVKLVSLVDLRENHLDRLKTLGKNRHTRIEKIEDYIIDEIAKIEFEDYEGHVYDLQVKNEHHSFVVSDGILVSNCFFYAKEGQPIYEPTLEQIRLMLRRAREENVPCNAVQLSLDYNEKIVIKDKNGFVKPVKIGEFVDSLMVNPEKRDYPIPHERSKVRGYKVLSVDQSLNPSFVEISEVIRHENNDEILEIETDYGWRVRVSKSHSVFIFDGDLRVVNAEKLRVGDILIGALNVPKGRTLDEIDLLQFADDKTMLVFDKKTIKTLEEELDGINHDAVRFKEWLKSSKPEPLGIKYFNSSVVIPTKLRVTKELMRLLGYYLGEGCCYRDGVQFSFGKKDIELIEDCIECAKAVFGIEPRVRECENTINVYRPSRIFKVVFGKMFGERSKKKRIHWTIFNVNDDMKMELLKAYFRCNGNVRIRKSGYEIVHNTASEELARDLVLLHLQMGIVCSVHESKVKPHVIEKKGQLVKGSVKFVIVIRGKEELRKALWYLDENLRRKFERYVRGEKHSRTIERLPLDVLGIRLKGYKIISKEKLRNLTERWMAEGVEFAKILNHISHANIGFFRVRRIKRVKPKSKYLYDVSVPNTQAFFGGFAILVHNTGGEPTLRNDLVEIIKIAKEEGYDHVQLNTDGIRLAFDKEFIREIRDAGVNTIYLSFDGVSPITNWKNHWEIPLILKNIRDVGGPGLVLVPTVIRNVNDGELGEMINFGLNHIDIVRGVNFQPISMVGRVPKDERAMFRITIPRALKLIEEQTNGAIEMEDWYPVPVAGYIAKFFDVFLGKRYYMTSHFACGCATYVFLDGDRVIPITRFVDVDGLIEYLSERADEVWGGKVGKLKRLKVSSDLILKFIRRFYDDSKAPRTLKVINILKNTFLHGNYKALGDFHRKTLFLGMMHFQDEYNYDVERVERCVIHYGMPDGRIVPFCAFNVIPEFYRDEIQAKFSYSWEEWKRLHPDWSYKGDKYVRRREFIEDMMKSEIYMETYNVKNYFL